MKRTVYLDETDLAEQFSRASGPGGQNINKVATRVTLTHIPTGVTVTVQEARSQAANRRLARERLLAAIQEQEQEKERTERQRREKRRRQKRTRPQGVKRRMVESKRRRAEVKKGRGKVDLE
jgi:protein subunit release factor B